MQQNHALVYPFSFSVIKVTTCLLVQRNNRVGSRRRISLINKSMNRVHLQLMRDTQLQTRCENTKQEPPVCCSSTACELIMDVERVASAVVASQRCQLFGTAVVASQRCQLFGTIE